ncbi:MAG: preprotein translocase subunit SecG [Planctomycetes bacterium]|nr:preprotein translocase subunit SecG [Planctomycetota bacterium]
MIIEIILWFIFIGSAILLSIVILLQEAKGGGLAEAFGGLGAQTFGVKASGINKFTAYVAVVFLLTAVLITCMRKSATVVDFTEPVNSDLPVQEAGAEPGAAGTGDVGTPSEGGGR